MGKNNLENFTDEELRQELKKRADKKYLIEELAEMNEVIEKFNRRRKEILDQLKK